MKSKTMKSKSNPFHSPALSGAAVVFACFSMLNPSAQASTGSWIGSAGDNSIFNPSNWTPAGVPGGFADVNFDSNTVDGIMDLSGATMSLSSLTLSSALTVPITINTGNFVVGNGLIDLSASNVDLTINSAYNLWYPSANFNVGAGRTLTMNGAISDVGFTDDGPKPFTKNGAGTAVFSGANTYRGATTVNAGTLVVNGNISTSVSTTVSTGGTLAGTGTVGATTIQNTGILAPGDGGIESLNTGALTLDVGSFSNFEINTTGDSSDLAISSALLTFGGTLNVSNIGGALVINDTFNLFDWNTTSGTFSAVNLPGLDPGLSWNTGNLYTSGTITVIPEPRAALLGAIGLLALLRRRR